MLTEPQYEMAPCLQEEMIAEAARSFVTAASELGGSPAASILRAWCVVHIFEQREKVFALNEPPAPAMRKVLTDAAAALRAVQCSGLAHIGEQYATESEGHQDPESVESVTGSHYGHLFSSFSPTSFWEEAASLLRLRLDRNGVDLEGVRDKSVVDVGCGGGRYTAAWRSLGATPVLGVDVSPANIDSARQRIEEAGLDRTRFETGNVLALSIEDNTFDIVFSNGVLHHTRDWKKGVDELLRILKPGGLGWLYVIENPGGLYWDSIEVLRVVMANENRETARRNLRALGLPANRIFYMLDHVMVPINVRLTSHEIEECLRSNGATHIRRLERGVDFDRIERIYQCEPFASEKYGIGENRYVFSKD